MSQTLNYVPAFDGTNYGYWKIVETGWIKPEDTTDELTVAQTNAWLFNNKALHALCQALSQFEFARISNCESAQQAWQILKTTYEGTKLVKSAKFQILISRFEKIKMLKDETFSEFYTKISDLRNSMVSLGKMILECKTHLKDSKVFARTFQDQSYHNWRKQWPGVNEDWRVGRIIASNQKGKDNCPWSIWKKKEAKVSSEEDSNNDEEDAMAMLAKNFERSKKKDPRGPKCFECPGFGHMWESQVGLREGLQRYSQWWVKRRNRNSW
jgi:hypothetical protein